MPVIVRRPPVSTKIAVAIDEETRWRNSDRRLLEGEIAVSYRNTYNPHDRKNHKTDFHLRVGRKLPDGTLSTWKDAAPFSMELMDSSLREELYQEIFGRLSSVFVFQYQFDEAKRELNMLAQRIDRLSADVQGHVNAKVKKSNETLYLLRNSELSTVAI